MKIIKQSFLLIAIFLYPGFLSADIADFEDVPAHQVTHGEIVTSGGLDFEFDLSGSGANVLIDTSWASVVGSGNSIVINNNGRFSINSFPAITDSLKFDFGIYNAGILEQLNGQTVNQSLTSLHNQTIDGVAFTWTNQGSQSGNPYGTIEMDGEITSMTVFGTELILDDFDYNVSAVPEPASFGLLFFLMIGTLRRRNS